jgi:streptogramin lyase
VASGQTTLLAPGKYGQVTVNGTLRLSGGLYELQNLTLGAGASVIDNAASIVRVAGQVSGADRVRIEPAAPLGPSALRLVVAGATDATGGLVLGTDAHLSALVVSRAAVRAGDRLVGVGTVGARDVLLAHDTQFTFNTGFGCSADAHCDDGNACTADACVDAQCIHSPVADGTVCDDGNRCTQTDLCVAGACTGANPITCNPPDACHQAGSCNPITGACFGQVAVPDGTSCNDGNACTQTDVCVTGACTGTNPVVCTAPDACHAAGTCNPATGVCEGGGGPSSGDGGGTSGQIVEFDLPSFGSPHDIVTGPDCNLWFVDDGSRVSRITPSGVITQFPVSGNVRTIDIAAGSDGNLWFTMFNGVNGIGKITTDGAVTQFPTPNLAGAPEDITAGPDGNLWFTEFGTNAKVIGRITTTGVISEFPIPTLAGGFQGTPSDIAAGPDGNVWYSDAVEAALGQVTPLGVITLFPAFAATNAVTTGPDGNLWYTTDFAVANLSPNGSGGAHFNLPSGATDSFSITRGPDGNVWFTESSSIARVTPAGVITEFSVPFLRPVGITTGPDGNLWFGDQQIAGKIGRITP